MDGLAERVSTYVEGLCASLISDVENTAMVSSQATRGATHIDKHDQQQAPTGKKTVTSAITPDLNRPTRRCPKAAVIPFIALR